MSETHLIGLTVVIVVGMSAQWLAWRIRLPSILLLLLGGFVAGPDMLGLLEPQELLGNLFLPLVAISAALILFEGGLTLRLGELGAHGPMVGRLCSLGALITWGLVFLAARYVVGLDARIALLLGAILTVSGPTVVQPLLRHIRPRHPTGPILKWEGILIDPIGAILAVLVFEALMIGAVAEAAPHVLLGLLETILVAGVVGVAVAWLLLRVLEQYLVPDFLHNPLALALVVGAFTASNAVHPDSGLLTVTFIGILLANRADVSVSHIVEFKENLRVLLLSGVFVLLAANLRLADIQRLDLSALAFLGVLLFVVRPIEVFVCAIGSPLTWKERVFLSWVFPRGIVAAAVASVFALRLKEAGWDGAEDLVSLTFLVILGTVLVYGLTAPALARRLGLATPAPQGALIVGAHPWAREVAGALRACDLPVLLVDTNYNNLVAARMEGLPTYYGSALSEHAEEAMDLSALGNLLALTPNDEVNTLTALHYLHVFGRERVYQLASRRVSARRKERVPTQLRGRTLFADDAHYQAISARRTAGARMKATKLTEEFTLEDFRVRYGDHALPMFAVKDGKLSIATARQPLEPPAGHTLIALIDEERL